MIVFPEKSSYENPPPGSFGAICYRVLDIGHQFSQYYQKVEHKIIISWELDEAMKDGRPFSISKRYTLSSGKKANLRKDLESWRGKAFTEEEYGTFDLGKLIGVPCMLGITQTVRDGETRADVTSVMGLPKGMTPLQLTNEKVYFSLNNFDQGVYDKLSEGLRTIIAKSPEYAKIKGLDKSEPESQGEMPDDSAPF